jgi:ClpP class serine protease
LTAFAGRTAQISIVGILTQTPDWLASIFGGGNTTYVEIIEALQSADANPEVDDIELVIDSPGGQTAGLFEAMAAVGSTAKPTRATIQSLGASAAYGLASQADDVVALNRATRIGSVGVAISFWVQEEVVEIASTEAPKKRPDLTSDEGKAVVREELDALHALFAGAIADGRGTTVKDVNAKFGQGAVVLADEALSVGMIDSVANDVPASRGREKKPKTSTAGGMENQMLLTLEALKAQHPGAYAAARVEGVACERDRVLAHLTLGQSCGALDTAIAAVREGTSMTQELTAKYLSASVNKSRAATRVAEDSTAAVATGGAANSSAETPDVDDQAVALLEQQRGGQLNG